MAIPKEPRQLMINIMYLVLTALLALNVSAEIFNAFKVVNKGLEKSNEVLDESNKKKPDAIAQYAQKDPEKYQKYADLAPEVVKTGDEFSNYVEGIWEALVKGSDPGGDGYKEDANGQRVLKNKKNKDITTRLLVDQGKGKELRQRILDTRDKFLSYIDEEDRESFKKQIALEIDDESYKKSKDKKSWEEFNFKQMPIGAVHPMLTKYINDAKATESAVLNYFIDKVGGKDVVFDQFKVVSAPEKSYVIAGETFKTDIFLSAASENVDDLSVTVNGRELKVENGVAEYTAGTSSTGKKKYTAKISFNNPVTGETTEVDGAFEYEVGRRSVSVSADKMNVFYIGVDNPITVAAAGISSNAVNVTGQGGGIKITRVDGPTYNVTVSKPGEAQVVVSGGGLDPSPFNFRVKRIPDPVPKLSGKRGGGIPNGIFRAQLGLIADLEDFDFEARCNIQGFTLVRVAKRSDPESAINAGGKFSGQAQSLVNKASPGDRYFFEEIKAKCPGDIAGRNVGSMSFVIR